MGEEKIMSNLRYAAMSVILVVACGNQVRAQTVTGSSVAVEDAWARATPIRAETGVIYMTLVNGGIVGDRLLGATTPMAERVEFHSNMNDNGVMKMRELSTIGVAPGARVILKPSGTHAMLLGLKQPLKEGQSFPITLTFEKAGKIDVIVSTVKFGAVKYP
jgi:periplasmic copper chaperone A